MAIDDTPANLELLSEALQQEGLSHLHLLRTPEEGLDLIFQEHPQIVLLDLVMPKLTGLEVLERIVEFDPARPFITAQWPGGQRRYPAWRQPGRPAGR